MYTVIRTYNIFPKTVEDFIQDLQENLLHILRQVPGLRAYDLLESEDKEVVVINTFDSLADAKTAARLTMDWVGKHPELYFQGFSKPLTGEIRVHSGPIRPLQTRGQEHLQGVF
jgi:Antibiotic biosynthesis monooxygenase